MKVFIIQSGSINSAGVKNYSISTKRQVSLLKANGIEVKVGLVTSRTSLLGIRKNIILLKKKVAKFHPDVIHSHYGSIIGYISRQVAKNKYPLIVSFCGDDLLGTINTGLMWKIRQYFAKYISKIVSKEAGQIIVKSQNLFDLLPKKETIKYYNYSKWCKYRVF